MRRLLCAVLAILAGCGNKSKLDGDRAADVDALWALAPDGTELGVVASPRAVDLAFRGFAAVRALTAQPDMAPARPQLDGIARAMFGSETATPEDAGFAADRPFAMFATSDGVIGIMPVGDRDRFMMAKKGTRGSAEDTLESNTCRLLDGRYVCATNVAMFDRLGKGTLRGALKDAGARGDAELYLNGLSLLGDTRGTLLVAAQLARGQVSLHGRWSGTPGGLLQQLVGVTAPPPDTRDASGFVAFNVAPLLASLADLPLAGGVTTQQLGASLAGPVSAVIPAGSIDIQIHVPLKDPAPATKIVESCSDLGAFFTLAATQTPGTCRIVLEGANALELDMWVEGSSLRLGAKKGPAPAGSPGALTPVGRELAAKDWTASLWGRGTMLNLSGITPTQQEVPEQVALGIHAMSLVNELGAAARVEPTGVRFRVFLRTAFANPPDVVDRYVTIGGADIISGKATESARTIAQTAASSPFASDFAAGQGGLMIPAAAIGLASAVLIPAVTSYVSGEEPSQPPGAGGSMNNADLVRLLASAYVEEAFPKWRADHKGEKCPTRLEDLAAYFGSDPGIPVLTDPWNHRLVMQCDDTGLVVLSVGPDGTQGTADDVRVP